ncbi:hypothetical protein QFC21_007174 [Naganishia friedmannii]|uniref:Uncharacterized protein n=1 Tax=Naganishia friedmannii TaxID=89922 RepID=A0ACC2UX73_9TREE|nr:hypothetical protein QFC21_007174 [Naganishia friedmannii]
MPVHLVDAGRSIGTRLTKLYLMRKRSSRQPIPGITCGQAAAIRPPGFNVFVGEFSLQSTYNNNSLEISRRQEVYNSQVVSFQKYLYDGNFWDTKFAVMTPVLGKGTQN